MGEHHVIKHFQNIGCIKIGKNVHIPKNENWKLGKTGTLCLLKKLKMRLSNKKVTDYVRLDLRSYA